MKIHDYGVWILVRFGLGSWFGLSRRYFRYSEDVVDEIFNLISGVSSNDISARISIIVNGTEFKNAYLSVAFGVEARSSITSADGLRNYIRENAAKQLIKDVRTHEIK